MPKYLVKSHSIKHNGKDYAPGAEIELSEAEASALGEVFVESASAETETTETETTETETVTEEKGNGSSRKPR
jgi:hypothetical protein